MNLAAVDQIARAVLYEGYMLYPYRQSSVKNRQRWNFGVLYPPAYSEMQGGTDPCFSQTECLLEGAVIPALEVRIKFLQLVDRTVGKLLSPVREMPKNAEPGFNFVERLEFNGNVFQPWQEAVEREICLQLLYGDSLNFEPSSHEYSFAPGRQIEELRNSDGLIVGATVREHQSLRVGVEASARPANGGNVFRVTVRVRNLTPLTFQEQTTRDQALRSSLLSAHVVLGAKNGQFISLLEPPDELREVAAGCQNIGTWPVLVGNAGERDTLLSSPIILYDYPEIAPESAGDLFDGTEIDEILSLRIMTMTEEEKREMRESDEKTRQILERTESLPPEQLMKLHGVVRALRPIKGEAP
jgi:hypothetical protein